MTIEIRVRPASDLTDQGKAGYARVRARIDYGQMPEHQFSRSPVLVWLCRPDAWPEGTIDLRGLPW